jgi:hypothetical protein
MRRMPNWSVDSDTLRQGAARCRWKSCTVRPLAATCRSPFYVRHRAPSQITSDAHLQRRHDPLNFQFDYNPTETAALRSRTYENLSIEDLRRIALWKLDRVLDVPDGLLAKLRALPGNRNVTARSPQAIDVLERLVQCDGVGYPMASAILKFIHPRVFPIIDVRAYRALFGKRLRTHDYTTELYLEYVDKLQEIAAKRQVDLAVVDEQLYCFDKAKNGKIDA